MTCANPFRRRVPGLLVGMLLLAAATLPGRPAAARDWSLGEALAHARDNNPDARLAVHRIARAQAAVRQARAAYSPQLEIGSSYLRTDHPVSVFGFALNQESFSPALDFNDVPDADNLNVQGTLSLNLYSGGRRGAEVDAARALLDAAGHGRQAVWNLLELEVGRAFFTAVKTGGFVEATEGAVLAFKSSLSTAQRRLQAGTVLRNDLLDVEVRLAQSEEDLVLARNANALALRSLRTLLGIEDDAPFGIATNGGVPGLPPEAAVASGAPDRPELSSARSRIRAAEARVRREKAGLLPAVDAFGTVQHDSGSEFDGSGASYVAGVQVRWKAWDGLLTRGRIDEARADLQSAIEESRKLELAIQLEIEQAELRLRAADERLAVTRKAVEQATESAELVRNRFDEGVAITTQLIDAETALTAARVRREEAHADRLIAIAELRRALGLPLLDESTDTDRK